MKRALLLFILICAPAYLSAFQDAGNNTEPYIITVGGSVTETVFALGMGEYVMATDESSTHPPQVFQMPRVPYMRNLTSEGILSLTPKLIIASEHSGPESAINQIQQAGVEIALIPEIESMDGVIAKIEAIGLILGKQDKAQELISQNQAAYQKAADLRRTLSTSPKVLFVLSTRNGRSFMVAGEQTSAATMIELAGGENAMTGFTGYKTVTNEALLMANPDMVLVMETRLDEIKNGLQTTPGINSITAVREDNFIGMDGNLLLGFGPRFGTGILELMKHLHPEINVNP